MNYVKEWIEKDDNRIKFYVLQAFIVVFYVLFLYVICESSYTADDLLNSNILGVKYIGEESVWHVTLRIGKEWMDAGRFFPCSDYVYALFYFVPSRLVYKVLIVISVYINSVLFGKCIEKISGSKEMGCLTMVMFPFSIQLTGEFNSALYAFHMLMQMVFLWSLLSLFLIIKCIEIDKNHKIKRWLCYIGSGIMLFMGLCTYEVAFVIVVFIGLCVLAYTKKWSRTLKVLIPDFVAYAIACVINIILRMNVSDVGYSGISINLNPTAIITTFAKQSLSVLPLNRFIVNTLRYGEIPYSAEELAGCLRWTDILLVALYIALIVLICRSIRKHMGIIKNVSYLILGGISLMVFPALLISITARYQNDLDWGINHLVAYIQSFGLALVFACIYVVLIKKLNKKICIIILSICTVSGCGVLLLQEAEARAFTYRNNLNFRCAVENIQRAAVSNLFEEIQPDDVVFGISDYYYDGAESNIFYSKYARRKMPVKCRQELDEYAGTLSEGYCEDNNVYVINSGANETNGYVYIAHIIGEDNNPQAELHSDRIRIYVSSDDSAMIRYTDAGNEKEMAVSRLKAVQEDEDGCVYEIYGESIVISSIAIEIN